MGTPLGEFIRAKRDATQPSDFGIVEHGPRRAPGLRRSELAGRAKISVEYLTRIEQGRDRNPTGPVINAIADAFGLEGRERRHLDYLAKITGGACATHAPPERPTRQVRPSVRKTLDLLEPGIAMLTNRLGDILAYTDGFERIMRPTGMLDTDEPNLTRFVFTDHSAREVFPDWGQVADEQAFNLWLGPSAGASEWFKTELSPIAGAEFTSRLDQHLPPDRLPLRIRVRDQLEVRFDRETLELSDPDAQQVIIFLPADQPTTEVVRGLRSDGANLRAI